MLGIPTSVSKSALMVFNAVSSSLVIKLPLRSEEKYIHGDCPEAPVLEALSKDESTKTAGLPCMISSNIFLKDSAPALLPAANTYASRLLIRLLWMVWAARAIMSP